MPTQGPDLVLIHPGHRTAIYQSLGASLSAVEPPVWAGLIATFARQHGQTVVVIDCEAEDIDADEAADRVADLKPRLAAVVVYGHQPSASTQNMTMAGAICRAIKARTAVPTLLVGGHVAALPERTLREEEAADFVAGGEGPATIVDLLRALGSAAPDFSAVQGLWYRDGAAVRSTAPAPLVTALDRLMAEPAWDLLPMERYRAHNWHTFGHPSRQPYAALYTTLGCPYHCTFCCIQAPFKDGEAALGYPAAVNSYRRWRPDTVVAAIDRLVDGYGVRHIKIADEMFVLHRPHVDAICGQLIARRHDLNLWAYARIDTVGDDRLLETLRQAGVRWLAFGIESGASRVRDEARKPFDQEAILRAIARVRAAGIHVIANFIFGLPEDTAESMQATLDLAIELNCEFANFNTAMAYPGSALYGAALNAGWRLPAAWTGYSQHAVDTLPLSTRTLSASEVLRFRDRAWRTYFTNAGYLSMMERTFGAGVRQQIEAMTGHTLVRHHA